MGIGASYKSSISRSRETENHLKTGSRLKGSSTRLFEIPFV